MYPGVFSINRPARGVYGDFLTLLAPRLSG
jgi:hypothetical protein